MKKYEPHPTHYDLFEYFGNTEIVRIRKQNGATVRKDWLMFNSVDEAMEYFNTACGESAVRYQ